MDRSIFTPKSLADPLQQCGYRPDLLRNDFRFGDEQMVPLVAFAHAPFDARSACIAVLSSDVSPKAAVESCRGLGSPLAFVCLEDSLQWWKQGARSAEYIESVSKEEVPRFFEAHRESFSPSAIYRAKTWGRFKPGYQLSFVDLGLMPVVEEEVGTRLGTLIERNVAGLKSALGWTHITNEQGQWLLESIFWLVSAKILHDKQVDAFANISLTEINDVFERVARHYGSRPLRADSASKIEGLVTCAADIQRFSSLVLTTTESLAYVYENTLISKETRSSLGTHSTPQFLVDYVVGSLADWIAEIPILARNVFEPACGHAAFLVSAMRLLTDLLPDEERTAARRGPYLRSRLHGLDIDTFALELARLSLTLADIPNPNGWDLQAGDMFRGYVLDQQATDKTILLANPPFENFKSKELDSNSGEHSRGQFLSKASEMVWRTLPRLRAGGVFGLILPQSFLHSANAREIREFVLKNCEIREICLFPDKIFSFSDAESAVVIGRRKIARPHSAIRYRRIREADVQAFQSDYEASTTRNVLQSEFAEAPLYSLRSADLSEVWEYLRSNPSLSQAATVGQGLSYRNRDLLPQESKTYSEVHFEPSKVGFILFDGDLQVHELPKQYWMSLDPSVIDRPRSGTKGGVPQVLLNYARTSRGPWRIKALLDRAGHPISSRFIAVRPKNESYSVEVLWGILNSPVANAYAFAHLSKRDNIVGDIRRIPLPPSSMVKNLEEAVSAYLEAVWSNAKPVNAMRLLLRVDHEVLRAYKLPSQLERTLLKVFDGWPRGGVPFDQSRYVPMELANSVAFSEFFEFEEDWSATNRERGMLIDKKVHATLTPQERSRLTALQAYAEYHVKQVAPRPTDALEELERRLFLK